MTSSHSFASAGLPICLGKEVINRLLSKPPLSSHLKRRELPLFDHRVCGFFMGAQIGCEFTPRRPVGNGYPLSFIRTRKEWSLCLGRLVALTVLAIVGTFSYFGAAAGGNAWRHRDCILQIRCIPESISDFGVIEHGQTRTVCRQSL